MLCCLTKTKLEMLPFFVFYPGMVFFTDVPLGFYQLIVTFCTLDVSFTVTNGTALISEKGLKCLLYGLFYRCTVLCCTYLMKYRMYFMKY